MDFKLIMLVMRKFMLYHLGSLDGKLMGDPMDGRFKVYPKWKFTSINKK